MARERDRADERGAPPIARTVARFVVVGCAAAAAACGPSIPPPQSPSPQTAQGCAEKGVIPVVPFKVAPPPADARKGTFELKSDGSMLHDAKLVGRFACNEVQDEAGKTVAIVKADGTLVGRLVIGDARFEGDDLVVRQSNDKGAKVMRFHVDDDGTMSVGTSVIGGGSEQNTVLGKFNGAGSAKRAAVLSFLYGWDLVRAHGIPDAAP